MSIGSELYGSDSGRDMAQVLYGVNARHVPCWAYLQHQGEGIVSFVGASRVSAAPHPLRYGSTRTHVFMVGEIIVRPHLAVATDAYAGHELGGLATESHDFREMLAQGELLIGSLGVVGQK